MKKKYQIIGLLLLFASHAEASSDAPQPSAAATPDSGAKDFGATKDAAEEAAADDSVAEEGAAEEKKAAEGQGDQSAEQDSESSSSGDGYVFGYRNGYFHAALGAKGEWTDNLYNTSADQQDNFLTQISPSVWITLPRRSKRPVQIVSDNTAPGGMQYSQPDADVINKLQAYLAGTVDLMAYSADSDLNHAQGDIEAMLEYQAMDKLAFQLLDKYNHSQDIFNITQATEDNQRVYDSNIFGAGAAWYSQDRFSLKGGYKNFVLEYEEAVNNFMNRSDNGFECALFYKHSDRTDYFVEYEYLFAEYDEELMPDNDNSFLSLGVNWQATVKTSLMAKAGYQKVDYDDVGDASYSVDDSEGSLYFESQGIWHATVKSNVLLNAKYSIEQSDSAQALNKTVFSLRLAFDHRFTDRIRGDANLVYENSDYAQFSGDSRTDDRWYFKPSLQYALNKWLFLNGYLSFDSKDSNYDGLDYDTTTIGFGVRGSF